MKIAANSPLMTYILAGGTQFLMAELYTFTLRDGSELFYTNLDIDITYGGDTFVSNSIRIEGLKFKITVGVEVDEQEIRISAFPTDVLGTAAFFTAVGSGLLDGAYIKRQRAYWQPDTGIPAIDYQGAPLDVVTLFTGIVSEIGKLGRTTAELKVKSPLKLLDIDMPRNTYQPGCQWLLYDAGCGLVRATFTDSYVVVSATEVTITVTSVSPETGADSLPYYLQGRLLFTSGANDGLQTLVRTNNATTFLLQYPLLETPSAGDTFDVSAGCSKIGRDGACELKFNNLAKFRGFPRVPPIVVTV